eukprot:CAMPEP_0202877364 /NCGR_PEP_ID=MMETSP1391-20130828/30539_1 /ASSEMBLY_ACC=CAM_ASM_000867 /TAXON_ID=1034604 /ORGANISM="Chlamydomonas leiostraca, Strain SAG 11-49" /LENGTH=69 /DNA_ID=CAMNT_0049559391 /DNA_START=110 /DNA_END=319 /DNA_ORIENTATION=-
MTMFGRTPLTDVTSQYSHQLTGAFSSATVAAASSGAQVSLLPIAKPLAAPSLSGPPPAAAARNNLRMMR